MFMTDNAKEFVAEDKTMPLTIVDAVDDVEADTAAAAADSTSATTDVSMSELLQQINDLVGKVVDERLLKVEELLKSKAPEKVEEAVVQQKASDKKTEEKMIRILNDPARQPKVEKELMAYTPEWELEKDAYIETITKKYN